MRTYFFRLKSILIKTNRLEKSIGVGLLDWIPNKIHLIQSQGVSRTTPSVLWMGLWNLLEYTSNGKRNAVETLSTRKIQSILRVLFWITRILFSCNKGEQGEFTKRLDNGSFSLFSKLLFIFLLQSMKETISIKYGSLIKKVELPMCFNASSLEECIQTVLHCKQKSIFGLRLTNSIHIYPLEAYKSAEELLASCNDDAEIFSIVFQSNFAW